MRTLIVVALLSLVACKSATTQLADEVSKEDLAILDTIGVVEVWTVRAASRVIHLKDEETGKSIDVQMVTLESNGGPVQKVYTTGCVLAVGDEVKRPCRMASSPNRFVWRAE